MRILCLNCGSSSLKFDVMDVEQGGKPSSLRRGNVERIGRSSRLKTEHGGKEEQRDVDASDHSRALAAVLGDLRDHGLLSGLHAVAHRVVHGGPALFEPVMIDDAVMGAIEEATELAPLHNRPALATIRATREQLGPDMPMTASFDTGFFHELPDVAREYALPADLRERYKIRRYGFHGLAHRYMLETLTRLRPELARGRIVTLQLGNGSSAAAIRAGLPTDTSMGFSPLEGLIMGTRSGDLDPMLPSFIAHHEGFSLDQVESLLNTRSGLLGLSGSSNDMRALQEAAAAGDAKADLAVRAYCYRVRKYIGAYAAALGGIDALVFGGGIGENSASVRQAVCDGFAWLGLKLDDAANEAPRRDGPISTPYSAVAVYVVGVDEARILATDAVSCFP